VLLRYFLIDLLLYQLSKFVWLESHGRTHCLVLSLISHPNPFLANESLETDYIVLSARGSTVTTTGAKLTKQLAKKTPKRRTC
jgi:hypothetical protein